MTAERVAHFTHTHTHTQEMKAHNFNEDCPVFGGLFDFCRLYAGASIQAAARLNSGAADVAINWGGGLHHAKKSEVKSCVCVCLCGRRERGTVGTHTHTHTHTHLPTRRLGSAT